ncbi:hypothetical protein E4U17_003140 [Claviceps sp. LM77 group G4]|nr:hypothetical protein E4U17_003140 [Claviceps sp. LM77 group G4]KAG6066334.1 hypothetical protein E4U33_005609 [Claviceps sp. LM78 group G4]KAG6073392.1 hypothetical protein E4U16_004715 [Claviceps sp. LM84 group G4]
MYSTYLLSMAFAGLSLLAMTAAVPHNTRIDARAPAPTRDSRPWDPPNNSDDGWKSPESPDCPFC